MKERFDSYCGIYCGACSTPGCNGCMIMNDNHWSPDCKYIKCAQGKGIEMCPVCSDYPCEKIKEFETDKYIHHRTVVPNGRRIKEIGLEVGLGVGRRTGLVTADRCLQAGQGVAEEKVVFSTTLTRRNTEMRRNPPSARRVMAADSHLQRYGSSMMGLRHVSRRQALHLTVWSS